MQSVNRKLRKKVRLGLTWPQYQERIEDGRYQFHTLGKGFWITEILDHVEERVCVVVLLGGEDFMSWKEEAERKLLAFAKKNKCVAVEAGCRFGMAKTLARMGWRETRVEMRKDIQ